MGVVRHGVVGPKFHFSRASACALLPRVRPPRADELWAFAVTGRGRGCGRGRGPQSHQEQPMGKCCVCKSKSQLRVLTYSYVLYHPVTLASPLTDARNESRGTKQQIQAVRTTISSVR